MLSTVDRYILKEVAVTFLATLIVLMVMVLSYRLARFLAEAARGTLAQDSIWILLSLQALRYSIILIPVSMLLGSMIALGRLYQDSEMVALNACGCRPIDIYRPLFMLGVPVAILVSELALSIVPLAMELQNEIQAQARQDAEISVFQPGVFRKLADGQLVVYVGALANNGREMRDVFVHTRAPEGLLITTGARGYQRIDPQTHIRYLVLEDGYRYEGTPGLGEFDTLQYQRMTVRLDTVPKNHRRQRLEAISTQELLNSDEPRYDAEFQRRLSAPITVLLFTFLAPLLAHAKPRQSRYSKLTAAILLYTIYFNLIGVGQAWLERGKIPVGLGLWWIHGLLLLAGLVYWRVQYGSRSRPAAAH